MNKFGTYSLTPVASIPAAIYTTGTVLHAVNSGVYARNSGGSQGAIAYMPHGGNTLTLQSVPVGYRYQSAAATDGEALAIAVYNNSKMVVGSTTSGFELRNGDTGLYSGSMAYANGVWFGLHPSSANSYGSRSVDLVTWPSTSFSGTIGANYVLSAAGKFYVLGHRNVPDAQQWEFVIEESTDAIAWTRSEPLASGGAIEFIPDVAAAADQQTGRVVVIGRSVAIAGKSRAVRSETGTWTHVPAPEFTNSPGGYIQTAYGMVHDGERFVGLFGKNSGENVIGVSPDGEAFEYTSTGLSSGSSVSISYANGNMYVSNGATLYKATYEPAPSFWTGLIGCSVYE